VRLEIELAGSIHYERDDGSTKVEINAPIIAFEGDDFGVGFGMARTTFAVTDPPRWDGEAWTMVVDGRRLTRAAGAADAPDAGGSVRI
jgi:hypothetical protein